MNRIIWKDAGGFTPTVRVIADVADELNLDRFNTQSTTLAIRDGVLRDIREHARSAAVEVGGILVGEAYVDPVSGQYLVNVIGSLPAIGAHGTGTYFKFTPEAWNYISNQRAKRFPDLVTIGWYHSHPGLGVFYSATDRASQEAFFHHPWNVGLVIDPISDDIGVFVGRSCMRGDDCMVPYSRVSNAHFDPSLALAPSLRVDRRRWAMVACGAGIGGAIAVSLAGRRFRNH